MLLIQDLMAMDFLAEFDPLYLGFCFFGTIFCIVIVWIIGKLIVKDTTVLAEFIQASYRGSAAVLGSAFVLNVYGNTGMVPMMIIGAVPLYNIMAVIILEFESPTNYEEGKRKNFDFDKLKKSLRGIFTNPILIGIGIGVILSVLKVDFPVMIDNTISSFARMATPLALVAIGGTFEFSAVSKSKYYTAISCFIKLIGQAAILLPLAVYLGFEGEKLMALIVMLCAPTTPSCYVMAKGAGCDGVFTSGMVVITTIFSAFTITAIVFILRSIGAL